MGRVTPGREYPLGSHSYFDFSEFMWFAKEFDFKTKNFKEFTRYWFKKWGNEILAEAKKRTPVRTGELLDSWEPVKASIKGDKIILTIENTSDYASYVEYGHAVPHRGLEAGSDRAKPGDSDWVNGRFMLTVPVQQFLRDLPAEYEEAFWKYMIKKSK